MRYIWLGTLTAFILILAASVSFAGVIHEDVAYWWLDNQNLKTIFDPSTAWLNEHLDSIQIKVQQTVYDLSYSRTLLARNGDANVTGFLYAYSVTNLNCGDASDLTDMGLTSFKANWSIAPTYVTVSKQTPAGWAVDALASVPTWKWTSSVDPGILPGETVGGFWAVSNVNNDGVISATTVHVGGLGTDLDGETTGPVPDASSLSVLLTGLAGLGMLKIRRK